MTDELEEKRIALAHHRDRQMADALVVWIGLAAETHPEILREALSKVFDLAGIKASIQRVADSLRAVHKTANEIRVDAGRLKEDLDQLDRQIDGLRYDTEQLRRRGVRT